MSIATRTLLTIMLAFCLGFALADGSGLGALLVALALLAVLS